MFAGFGNFVPEADEEGKDQRPARAELHTVS